MLHKDFPFNEKWFPLAVTVALITLLSTIPLWWILLIPTILAIAFVMQTQILHTRRLAKQFWLSNYLREDSPLHRLLKQSYLLPLIAWIIAIPLAVVTYVTVYCYDLLDCCAVGVAIAGATEIHRRLSNAMSDNIAEHLVELTKIRVHYFLAIVFVLFALGLTSIAKSIFMVHSELTSDAIATRTIAEIKHPAKLVQDCARTLRYSELQLLRIRDINSGWIGWVIYLFFLIPNGLPAFGLVTFFTGMERKIGLLK
jgi:hypothetical protein